jgi:quinol monooxygenase YgiN
MTIIVAGHFDFEKPEEVPEMLTSARPLIEGALSEEGCIAYSWTQDHLTPGRVWVYEEWTTSEALDAHLNTDWYRNMGAHIGSFSMKPLEKPIKKYRVDLEEPVYDETGVARGQFFTEGK